MRTRRGEEKRGRERTFQLIFLFLLLYFEPLEARFVSLGLSSREEGGGESCSEIDRRVLPFLPLLPFSVFRRIQVLTLKEHRQIMSRSRIIIMIIRTKHAQHVSLRQQGKGTSRIYIMIPGCRCFCCCAARFTLSLSLEVFIRRERIDEGRKNRPDMRTRSGVKNQTLTCMCVHDDDS